MHRHGFSGVRILVLRVRVHVDISRWLMLGHEGDAATAVVNVVMLLLLLLLLLLRHWHVAASVAAVGVRPHSASSFEQRSGVVV